MRFAKTRVAVGFASTNDVNGNGRWKSVAPAVVRLDRRRASARNRYRQGEIDNRRSLDSVSDHVGLRFGGR